MTTDKITAETITNEQISALGAAARRSTDRDIQGLCDSALGLSGWWDGRLPPCAPMGEAAGRKAVTQILAGQATRLTVRTVGPNRRAVFRHVMASEARTWADRAEAIAAEWAAEAATPRYRAIAAARAASDAADAAWLASTLAMGGPGGNVSAALEESAIAAAAEVSRIAAQH
ncbi:MAG: hypothetical protein ACRCU1_18990 [Alsobacter sp.]